MVVVQVYDAVWIKKLGKWFIVMMILFSQKATSNQGCDLHYQKSVLTIYVFPYKLNAWNPVGTSAAPFYFDDDL